jgi:hypothetical protein
MIGLKGFCLGIGQGGKGGTSPPVEEVITADSTDITADNTVHTADEDEPE